jgi:hypothetical protein
VCRLLDYQRKSLLSLTISQATHTSFFCTAQKSKRKERRQNAQKKERRRKAQEEKERDEAKKKLKKTPRKKLKKKTKGRPEAGGAGEVNQREHDCAA